MAADVEVTHALLELGAATLGESGARAMRARVHAAWSGARLAAPAYPVRCTTGDNLAIHVAVARAPAGDALVADVGDFRELGYWGEVLTTGAKARGLSGLIIDGGVRDITEIEGHGFPVFSSMIALRGASKNKPGTVGQAIQCGGVLVEPGDWVVGDADGVVIVPEATLADVINAGRVRASKEDAMFRSLWEGKTTLDLLELDASPIEDGGRDTEADA
jgi:4-hydroxy-4-methyl-2-oxoglutarate aldolase